MSKPEKTDFGFKTVSPEEKTRLVTDVFRRVSGSYDKMNDLMSFGIHRFWKQQLVNLMRPRSNVSLLDIAGGTGDISLRFIEACRKVSASNVEVTVCDRNPAMVCEGRHKAFDHGFAGLPLWTVGDAASLPFADSSFDICSVAFGLRNVTDRMKALSEARRVLKPGGTFYCLEFSPLKPGIFSKLYHFHSFSVIPLMGDLFAGDRGAYEYLVESIACFPSAEELSGMMEEAGFRQVSFQKYSMGIVAIHIGMKI